MEKGYVALLDSGIGGLSLLKEMIKILPNEKYLYFGDNNNAPYGNKSVATLRELTLKNIDLIKRYNIKVLLLACNTLSVNLKDEIELYSGIKTFGVYPPVEKALLNSDKNLLLATERTAENYKGVKGLTAVGLKTLASQIEKNMFCLNDISIKDSLANKSGLFVDKPNYYHTVILGCTHYFFVKNRIFNYLKPREIIFGETFTAKAVERYLKSLKLLGKNKGNNILFLGENAKLNQNFFNFGSQN